MKKPSSIAMVAIDLDGTLVDSVADLHAAVVCMQSTLGLPMSSENAVRSWVGDGIAKLVHRSLTQDLHKEAPTEVFENAFSLFKDAYAQGNGQYSRLYLGVSTTLHWLYELSIPLVVVTNKARCFTLPLLEYLTIDHYFVHVVAGDDAPHKKPSPAPLQLATQLCSVTPNPCILIGDSIADFQSARAAGFLSVGVTYGYNRGTPVRDLPATEQPDMIIDQFSEVKERWSDIEKLCMERHPV